MNETLKNQAVNGEIYEILADSHLTDCRLCPRQCRVDRTRTAGFCGCGDTLFAARAALHHWEEPCISGSRGSGTVFFSGCTLRCCFCQNYKISQEHFGKALTVRQLADIFLRLQEQGAHNINLVTATQYLPWILPALDLVRDRLRIPVVYNCGGYERPEIVKALDGYVDIWLPDLKYRDPALSRRFSGAADYFETASLAIIQMIRQTGAPRFHTEPGDAPQIAANVPRTAARTQAEADYAPRAAAVAQAGTAAQASSGGPADCQIMDRGVILRHMVLPGHRDDSIRLLRWMGDSLPRGQYYISLLSQYTPFYHSGDYPELNRRITSYEYQKVVVEALALGLDQGFMQEKSSAKEEYTPPFDLEGI